MLKLQARLARGVGQCFDFAVKSRATAIKHNVFNAFVQSVLRSQCPDGFGAVHICGQLFPVRRAFARGRCGSQRDLRHVVNELNVNMLIAKAHAHARTLFGAADFLANAPMPQLREFLFFFLFSS
jgi:hypothetical protein